MRGLVAAQLLNPGIDLMGQKAIKTTALTLGGCRAGWSYEPVASAS